MPRENLPAAVDVERFVLGAVILDGNRMAEMRGTIQVDDFAIESHRRIWSTVCGLFDRGVVPDRVNVAEELHRTGKLESVGGVSALVDLDNGIPRLPNLDGYLRTIQEKAFLRRAALAGAELEKRCLLQCDTPEQIYEFTHGLLARLQPPTERAEFATPANVVETVGIDRILHPKRGIDSVPAPWEWLDGVLGGFSPEQLIIVGGRTSQGKTSAVTQAILHACLKGFPVPLFSLEMSKESIVRKMAAQLSGIDSERIKHNHLSRQEREQVHHAMGQLIEMPLHISDTAARNVAMIGAMLRRLRLQIGNFGMIVVDHLHALSASGSVENRTQQIGADVRALKLMAREFRCPVVVPAQLNNMAARENAKPTLADLRQSGEIAENADVVWFVWLDLNDESPLQKGQFLVAKQREGQRDARRNMQFIRGTQQWRESDCD